MLSGEYAKLLSACIESKHCRVCRGGNVNFNFSCFRPLDGSSAGLLAEATISIQGVNLAIAQIFQKVFTIVLPVTSSVVPLIRAEAAAVLSIKIRVGPGGAM